MRLSYKLSLSVAVGIGLVLSLSGYLRVVRQVAMFEADMRRDHRVLGVALSVAASSVATRSTVEAAVKLVEDADADHGHISIHWIPERERVSPSRLAGELESSVAEDENGGERYLVTRVPTALGEGSSGRIELTESMFEEREYVRATIVRTVFFTLLTIVTCTLVIVALSWLIVGRPLNAIMCKVRRVGDGDFSGSLDIRQGGEIGELAREIDAMCTHLAEARERIAQETNARIAALEQLRHADRLTTVGKLASGVAHELGTPLNVVAARAKMIERRESQGDEVIADARTIREQAERMTTIIRRLLDFTRYKRSAKQPHDIVAIVKKTLALLATIARKSDVALEGPDATTSLHAAVDAVQFEQIVTNLVVNAIQAQPDGGAVKVAVEPSSRKDVDAVAIIIEDEGPGMPEELRMHVFEPFFTTKDVGEGTGLGLSVVYGIVQEHDGAIDIDRASGGGCRFTVTLPRAHALSDSLAPV